MTNKKTTKQQLVASIVLLFMCFSMLLGTTFAWFTDSVTSAGNIIKTGTLDVEMYWAEGKEDPNASATVWADASKGPMFSPEELWEPGYVAARQIKIANKGTLDLKYNLNIVANGEVSELADVIDVYFIDPATQLADRTALTADKKIGTLTEVLAGINTGKLGANTLKAGDDAVVTIALKMQETAGNEYQDLGIGSSFSIQLLATQMASEDDSFDNQYDNGAYNTIIYDAAQLKSALEQGGNIIVAGEMNADGTFTVPFNPNRQTEYFIDAENVDSLNGGKYVLDDAANWGFTVVVDEGETLSLSDMDITADSAWVMNMVNNGTLKLSNINLVASNGAGVYAYGAKGTTTLDNLKVNHVNLSDPTAPWAATAVATSNGHNMIINGGTYVGSTYGVFVYSSGGKVTINGGTFKAPYVLAADGSYSDKNIRGELYVNGGNFDGKINMTNGHAYCEINGGTFTNFSVSTYNPVVIKGGTFDADPSAYVADGFKAIENNGTYVVVPENIDAVILTAADLLALSAKSFTANNGVAESYTIMLGADIDMNGADFSAIIAQRGDTLTFIGNGHIISNVNIISGADDNTTGQASMFYVYPNSTLNVSDLILKDITVTADANSTGYAAAVIGYCEGVAELNNVDVVNAAITGSKSSGLIAGHLSGNLTVKDSSFAGTVTLTDFEANGHYAGQYVGTLAGAASFTDTTAVATLGGNLHANNIGDIYGRYVSGSLEVLTSYVENDVTYYREEISGDVILYLVNSDYAESTLTIPEGVTTLGNYAFAYNDNVKTVVLASTVRELGRGFDSSKVEKVVLNEGLTTISTRAFRSTPNLQEVVISSTVTTIADNAFQKSGIKTIKIPANVKTVGETAFSASKIETVIFDGNTNIEGYAFRGCPNLRTVYLKGMDVNFVASSLNGRNSMWFCNGESNNPNTSNITFYVKTDVIKERVLTAMGAERNNTTVIVEMTTEEGGYITDSEGNAFAYDAPALDDALADGKNVTLAGNLTFNSNETYANSGYGATGVTVNGSVLDGNGYSLGVNNWGTWDSAINITGGTIKNLTVNSGMRGIFMGSATADVYIDNVVIDGTIYTFNSDGGNKNYGVYISNSTLNGWTSHSDVHKEVVYTNCSFGEGQGYAFCRPYGPTEFVGCDFEAGFEIDARGAVTFENCTIGGVALTAENLATLVTSNIANASVK